MATVGLNSSANVSSKKLNRLINTAETVDEDKVFDLFNSCSFNNISLSHEEDYSSEEEEVYGDEETILSMNTSHRSLLDSQLHLPVIPLLPTNPPPLHEMYWCEPDATTFRVRSKSYNEKRKKEPSKPSLFRLFAVDFVKVDKPVMSGICSHPDERVQKCLKAEREGKPGSEMPPFIFCVNIVIPGKPAYHAVFYYAVDDKSLIDPDCLNPDSHKTSPNPEFTNIASKFFFGPSDQFRDKTFKLIPRIASGNFVVKKAVGSKPTLLGTKLKQHYIRNDRFFELVIDVASDSIAKKVVGLSRGYAESLIVDMAFVLEGKSPSTLPENVMGTVRLSKIDFKANHRVLDEVNTDINSSLC